MPLTVTHVYLVVFPEDGDSRLPDVSNTVDGWNIPLITGQVAMFFVENQKRMCDADAIAEHLGGSGEALHPPMLIERSLIELEELGAVYVAKEAVTPEGSAVRIYALDDYMLAQAVVNEVEGISLRN